MFYVTTFSGYSSSVFVNIMVRTKLFAYLGLVINGADQVQLNNIDFLNSQATT